MCVIWCRLFLVECLAESRSGKRTCRGHISLGLGGPATLTQQRLSTKGWDADSCSTYCRRLWQSIWILGIWMKIHFKNTSIYFLAVSVVVGEVAMNRELDKWWSRKEQEERQLPGSTSRTPYSAVSLGENLQPPPSGAEALRLNQPRSVSRVAQAYLGGFAFPDLPTQIVDQPHKTLLEAHSETSLWYI